ncbi:MAG: hypothetical protein WB952_17900 [Terriglobales bacterium]
MELLLNIAWLMLALPAIWIWRRDADSSHPTRGFGIAVPFLILGCILLLLFPVVSATDDLHPMQADIEESNPRRAVKQLSGDRSGNWSSHAGSFFAQVASTARFGRCEEVFGLVFIASFLSPPVVPLMQRQPRAPPSYLG